jgi:putative hydrolase of the HAD superfamily
MNYKILLLDFDGVISNTKYFSEIYAEKFGIDLNIMLPFFDQLRNTTNIGQGDLKEMLKDVLEDWQWNGTVDELLKFWLDSDSEIDERFIPIVTNLRAKGIKVYLATDQEKYRAQFIWEERGLKNWLDGKFVSCDIGFMKSDPRFFQHIITTLNVHPSEIVFFDDSIQKVESARKAGVNAKHFTKFEDLNDILN